MVTCSFWCRASAGVAAAAVARGALATHHAEQVLEQLKIENDDVDVFLCSQHFTKRCAVQVWSSTSSMCIFMVAHKPHVCKTFTTENVQFLVTQGVDHLYDVPLSTYVARDWGARADPVCNVLEYRPHLSLQV